MNISTIIDAAAAGDPDRTALIIDGRAISYGELAAAVEQCAARPGRRRVGRHPRRGRRRRQSAVDRDGARCRTNRRCGGADEPGPDPAGVTGAGQERRVRRRRGCRGGVRRPTPRGRCVHRADRDRPFGRRPRSTAPPPAEDVDDRDALVLFTSGTTGLPKAIGITNGQLSARITGVAIPFRAEVPPTVSMMSVPFFHVGGAIGTLGNLYSGNTYVVQDRFDAGEWLRLVQAAPGDVHLLGADDAAADPRPSRLRQHRPDVSRRHRLRRGRRARRVDAHGRWPRCRMWRSPTCSVRPRPSAPTRLCCLTIIAIPTASGRSAARFPVSRSGWWTPRPESMSSPGRSASCG